MPSPIGHALAGLAVAVSFEPMPDAGAGTATVAPTSDAVRPTSNGGRSWRLPLICMALAILPDADLLYLPIHRTVTHSITASVMVIIIAAGVTGWVTGRINWRIALVCGAAYGSHILLDWLGADTNPPAGIQTLWPFRQDWFISPWTIFPMTEREEPFSMYAIVRNARAAATEIVVMLPILGLASLWRRSKASRLSHA